MSACEDSPREQRSLDLSFPELSWGVHPCSSRVWWAGVSFHPVTQDCPMLLSSYEADIILYE